MFKKMTTTAKNILWYFLGGFIYSSAVTIFISPNEISPGGLTGISTVLNYLFSFPTGITLFILNIPILIIGFIKFGGLFIFNTSCATALVSLSLTITDYLFMPFKTDKILAAVFGGILMGTGLSIVLRHGATTGGVDIIAKYINSKFRHLTVGKLLLIMDAVIIIFAAVIYKNVESVLYSILSMYASSRVLDIGLYGSDKGRVIYIVSEKSREICADINRIAKRGVTVISAKGGYTGEKKELLMCTVRIHEVSTIYSIVDEYDTNAFIVVSEAGEIIGEGFKAIN